MEWIQVLLTLATGGAVGTVVGRVWDNAREDRYRHADKKVEAAAEFMAAYEALRQPSRRSAGVTQDDLVRYTLASSRLRLLFGDEVIERADVLNADLLAVEAAEEGRGPEPVSTGLLAYFNAAVRQELGVGKPRRWYRRAPAKVVP